MHKNCKNSVFQVDYSKITNRDFIKLFSLSALLEGQVIQ